MDRPNEITLSLNLGMYTNLWIPLQDISPEALQEIDTRIEIAKQIMEKTISEGVSQPETSTASAPAPTPAPTSTSTGGEIRIDFGDKYTMQVSKYVKMDTSGKFPYHIYEVIYNGAVKTLKASAKLHEALSTLAPDDEVIVYKEKVINSKGREYQTYRVVKSDGTQVL